MRPFCSRKVGDAGKAEPLANAEFLNHEGHEAHEEKKIFVAFVVSLCIAGF
jgi:hypothetical protein